MNNRMIIHLFHDKEKEGAPGIFSIFTDPNYKRAVSLYSNFRLMQISFFFFFFLASGWVVRGAGVCFQTKLLQVGGGRFGSSTAGQQARHS